jgi:hypothetical protein
MFWGGIAYNVPSVSEVSRRGIWVRAIAEARYALLGEVHFIISKIRFLEKIYFPKIPSLILIVV